MTDAFARFPAALPSGARGGARFVLDPTRFAVRGGVPAELEDRVEDRLEGESLSVVSAPAEAAASLPEGLAVPVYVLAGGGAAYVPTGRATVRFREGTDAGAHDDELRELGYRITQVPPYAPHMAWVECLSDDVARALAGLEQLAGLPDVEHVEPQLISRGQRR